MTTPPIIEPGDCIHIAIPDQMIPQLRYNMARSISAAYEAVGVRVFNVDHVPDLVCTQIISVVRDVSDANVFRLDPASFGPGVVA
jgi:hypothetical protein